MHKGKLVPDTFFDALVPSIGLVAQMDGRLDGNRGGLPRTGTRLLLPALTAASASSGPRLGTRALDLNADQRLVT
jgi:hypothetical protein